MVGSGTRFDQLQHLRPERTQTTLAIQGPENGACSQIEIPDGCCGDRLRLLAAEFKQKKSPLIFVKRGGVR